MRWLRNLKLLLLMTCRDAAPLISYAMDRRLAAADRAALRVHLSICPSCRRYRGQLVFLRGVLAHLGNIEWAPADFEPLAPEARVRMRLRLRGA